MKTYKLIFAAASLAAFLSCAPSASAQTSAGVLDLSACGGGGIQVTLSVVYFIPTSLANHGCAITGASTSLTTGQGNVAPNITGDIQNLTVQVCSFFTIPGCTVPDFIHFSSIPNLHFDLSLIGPGPDTANCSNNFDQYEPTCGVFTAAQTGLAHDSPFFLIASTTGTSATLPLFGQVRENNTVTASFIGTITTQQVGVSQAAFQQFILGGGMQQSSYALSLHILPLPTITIGGVVNAASNTGTTIAPGEVVNIYGKNLSPVTSGEQLLPTGTVSPFGAGTEVLFGTTPASLIYTSPTQISAVAPYEITGSTAVTVLQSLVVPSAPAPVAIAPTAPGIFTISGGGTGQIDMVNSTGTLNSATSPAVKGTTVTFFATGEGVTSPAGVDGTLTGSKAPPKPVGAVVVTIGGVTATATAEEAPGAVAGVLQITATVPTTAASGTAIPVTLSVGGVAAQTGATMVIQ